MEPARPMLFVDDLFLQTRGKDYRAAVCFCYSPPGACFPGLLDCLDRDERQYLATLGSSKRRKSFLLGRYCAKTALRRLTGGDGLSSITVARGIFGQPVSTCLFSPNVQTTISHAGALTAALAFPEAVPLGVDVEKPDPGATAALAARTTERELSLLQDLPLSRPEALTMLWTAKEALAKAVKTGLSASYAIFEVAAVERQAHYVVCRFKHLRLFHTLTFALTGYLCSVAHPAQIKPGFDFGTLQDVFRRT